VPRSFTYNPDATAGRAALHIVFGVDQFYVPAMAITMLSVVEHNRDQAVLFHVVVSGLPSEDLASLEKFADQIKATIRIHDLDPAFFEAIPDKKSLSYATYFRLFIGTLLRGEAERALYIDCDIVCLRAIPPLPDLAEPMAAAAVLDVDQEYHNRSLSRGDTEPYFNAGVMVIDIARWNAMNLTERSLQQFSQHDKLPYLDQDALNLVLKDHVVLLDRAWNTFWHLYHGDRANHSDPIFLHYTGHKPWFRWDKNYLEPNFARYIDQSPWTRERLLTYPVKRSHKRLYARQLFKKGHVVSAALWFVRYLRMPKVVAKG